jgi:hypothetical protein
VDWADLRLVGEAPRMMSICCKSAIVSGYVPSLLAGASILMLESAITLPAKAIEQGAPMA